jgi:hypothetical protein
MILLLCSLVATSFGCAAFILCACAIAASAPPDPAIRLWEGGME